MFDDFSACLHRDLEAGSPAPVTSWPRLEDTYLDVANQLQKLTATKSASLLIFASNAVIGVSQTSITPAQSERFVKRCRDNWAKMDSRANVFFTEYHQLLCEKEKCTKCPPQCSPGSSQVRRPWKPQATFCWIPFGPI